MIELGREGVWVPDYRFVHTASGTDVFIEVARLLEAVEPGTPAPAPAPARPAAVRAGDLRSAQGRRGGLQDLPGPILRFKEIPNASELAALLDTFLGRTRRRSRGLFR